MDFGISLDASAVSQRHCLEDSDAEEDDEVDSGQIQLFTSPDVATSNAITGANLIMGIGQSASIFIESYLSLEPIPAFTVQTDSHTAFQSWPRSTHSQRSAYAVSEGFKVNCKNPEQENFIACTHKELLNTLQCNSWCSRVSTCLHRHTEN